MAGFSSITVNASGFDLQAHYEKMKAKREQQEKEFTEKWLDELCGLCILRNDRYLTKIVLTAICLSIILTTNNFQKESNYG